MERVVHQLADTYDLPKWNESNKDIYYLFPV